MTMFTIAPIKDDYDYNAFKRLYKEYTLFNTHLSFRFRFGDLLNDIYAQKMSVYDALNKSRFRELRQPGRFDYLKDITLEQLI